MFDWKILAASAVALLFVSGLFLGNFGIQDFISGLLDKIREWTSSSPFAGFFSSTPKKPSKIDMTVYPEAIQLKPEGSVEVKSKEFSLENFQGLINLSFDHKQMILKEAETGLLLETELRSTEIHDLRLAHLEMKDLKLEIEPDIRTENGSIQMTDFHGKSYIDAESVRFLGNVTQLKTKIGDQSWELK